jgi:hypothetical protein
VYGLDTILVVKSNADAAGKLSVSRSKQTTDCEFKEPNWAWWAAKSYWSLDEAAALVSGLDPNTVLQQSDDVLRCFTKMKQLITLLQTNKKIITSPMRPIQVVECFTLLHEMGAPPKLRKAVLEYENDPKRSFSLLAKRCEASEKRVKDLEQQLTDSKTLDPRERKSLLSLLCGLVHHHYRYDPDKRNDVVQTIRSMLAGLGIKLSDDIIRNWLKASFEYLPDSQYDTLGRVKPATDR